MARFTILTVFALAACSFAQVAVTNSGFATSSGPAVPATPVSPPIMYTPIIQLGQGPTQPATAVATPGGLATVEVPPQQQTGQPNPTLAPASSPTPFNFGVAQFGTPAALGGVGQDINGQSLADIAREQRQHPAGTNARVYTNNDINQLNQTGNSVNNPSAQANTPDNWSPENGVINPNGTPSETQPNAVGAPAQQNQSPTGVRSPFGPKPQSENYGPAGIDNTPAEPQAEARPFAQRERTQIAQNNPPAPPQDQASQSTSQTDATQSQPAQNKTQASQLPRTASKLPLVGVAGLFSVSMGIFVRYQRAKAR